MVSKVCLAARRQVHSDKKPRKVGDERFARGETQDDDGMRPTGILNVWFPEKKYGFIHQDNTDGAVVKHFLHEGNIKSGVPRPGAMVRFKSVVSRKGLLAVDAEILDGGAA